MADDNKGHAESGSGSVDQRADAQGVEEAAPEVGTVHRGSAPAVGASQSPAAGVAEWTASDSRGPLHEAPPLSHDTLSAHEDTIPAHEAITGEATPLRADDSTATEPPRHETGAVGEAPASASSQTFPSPVSPPEPARRSLLPVAAGLIVGALIGAGSAYLVYQSQPNQGADLGAKVAQLSGQIDALDQRPDPRQAIAALETSVAALNAKVASLKAAPATPAASTTVPAVGSSASTTAPSASTPAPAAGPSASDFAALQDRLTGLQASIDAVQKQAADAKAVDAKAVDGKVAALQSSMADIQKQASGAQAGVEAIQGQQKTFEGRLSAPALAVVADSLVQQIDQGQPYGQQVDALVTLGADPARVAILRENARKGVPSAKALSAQFQPLAEPILATEHKVAPNAGLFDRLKSGMSGMVSIRSTADTTGDDLASRVSRIEADLTHDDVTGAVATWNALPADAKAKSEAWGALAKTSAEAIDAARALQQGAIASLGGRKS